MSKDQDPRIAPKEMIVTRYKSAQQRRLRDKDSEKPPLAKPPPQKRGRKKKSVKSEKVEKSPVVVVTEEEEAKEYYPEKLKRVPGARREFLKPKPTLRTVARTNKRKFRTPQKGGHIINKHKPWPEDYPGRLKCQSPVYSELSMEEVVRIVEETHSLDDEDLMEILTCPSPVWWEEPADEMYIEEAICTRNPDDTPLSPIKEKCFQTYCAQVQKNSRRRSRTSRDSKVSNKAEDNIDTADLTKESDFKVKEKKDERFIKKRKKLENVLGNIKNKQNKAINNKKVKPTALKSNKEAQKTLLRSKDNNKVNAANDVIKTNDVNEVQCKDTTGTVEIKKYRKVKRISESTEEDMADLTADDEMLLDLENMDIPVESFLVERSASSASVILINDDDTNKITLINIDDDLDDNKIDYNVNMIDKCNIDDNMNTDVNVKLESDVNINSSSKIHEDFKIFDKVKIESLSNNADENKSEADINICKNVRLDDSVNIDINDSDKAEKVKINDSLNIDDNANINKNDNVSVNDKGCVNVNDNANTDDNDCVTIDDSANIEVNCTGVNDAVDVAKGNIALSGVAELKIIDLGPKDVKQELIHTYNQNNANKNELNDEVNATVTSGSKTIDETDNLDVIITSDERVQEEIHLKDVNLDINMLEVPKNLPPLKKRPRIEANAFPSPVSYKSTTDDITESSSVSSHDISDTISDTNIKFIMDEDIDDISDSEIKNDDSPKNVKDQINNVNVKNEDLDAKSSKDFITVYKIVPNDEKSKLNIKFKCIPEYSNHVEILKQADTKQDIENDCSMSDTKGQLNSFFKKCKNANRKRCRKTDDNFEMSNVKNDNKTSLCESCEPKKSITVAQDENVKYCLKCSSIFDTEECSYCLKSVKESDSIKSAFEGEGSNINISCLEHASENAT